MKYLIEYKDPLKGFLHLGLELYSEGDLYLKLPAWRPGRYERQNFAANIFFFQASDIDSGEILPCEKISRNEWKVRSGHGRTIRVTWQYYARQLDGGGSWIDDELFYVNPVNCMFYRAGSEYEPWTLELKLPLAFKIASGLNFQNGKSEGFSFFELADSPILASAALVSEHFIAGSVPHYLHAVGVPAIPEHVLQDFKKFTEPQISMMGDFPESSYHYLLLFLPRPHYHGVEHRNSTVIVLGPASEVFGEKLYPELLGISSHELFHAWNILKIRPAEMLPYRYSDENYFTTGFVAEGFTTYYGDLFLARAGVLSTQEYYSELNTQLLRFYENYGYRNMSLAESSFDLWVDGYANPSPHRKVSIYVKGCLISFCLDMKIRAASNNQNSLDTVLKKLWNDFGKAQRGYTYHDIVWLCSEAAGTNLSAYLQTLIYDRGDLKKELEEAFAYVGLKMVLDENQNPIEKNYGLRIRVVQERLFVDNIAPESPAALVLMKDDEITTIDELPDRLSMKMIRHQNEMVVEVMMDGEYFPKYLVLEDAEANEEKVESRRLWLTQ